MSRNIPRYGFRKELRQECEIFDLSHFWSSKGQMIFSPHRTDFYHLFYFRRAEGVHTVDFSELPLTDNSLLFVPKDSVHQFHRLTKADGLLLIFTDLFFCRSRQDHSLLRNCTLYTDITQNAPIPIPQKPNNLFVDIFGRISDELGREKDTVQTDILRNYIHILLLHIMREQTLHPLFVGQRNSPEWELVLSFRDMLEQHYTHSPQVAYFCQSLNTTEKRLQTATRKLLDRSPKELIKDRLLLEAKRLLVHSSDTVKEIAYRLGFDETTNFTKFFKKNTGRKPSDFRNNPNG